MDTRAQCHPLRPRGGPRRSGFEKNGFAHPDMYWKVSRHLSLCKLEATPSTPHGGPRYPAGQLMHF